MPASRGARAAAAAPLNATLSTGADVLADAVPHIVCVVSAPGVVEYLNARAIDYTGLRPADRAGAPALWAELVHPDDLDLARHGWDQATASGSPDERSYRIRRADGAFRWHQVRVVPVRGPHGGGAGWIGTATDIEEQRRSAERLRQAARAGAEVGALLDALEGAAPVGLGFVRPDGTLARANRALADLVAVAEPAGSVPAQAAAAGTPTVLPPAVQAVVRGVLDTGEPRCDDQATVPAQAGVAPLRCTAAIGYPVRVEGDLVGVGLAVADITGREHDREFRAVVMQNMTEGLCTVDDAGLLTAVNPAAADMLGWSADELVGRSMQAAVHPQRAAGTPLLASESPLARVRARGATVRTNDEAFVRRDGSVFPVSYCAAPLHTGSRIHGAVLVFRDITDLREQQRAEVADRHDQKLEALGRLSAGLAHEINTPIQFVGDNTRFLASSYQEMLELLLVYRECLGTPDDIAWEERRRRTDEAERKADLEYLEAEVPAAVEQSLEGIERVASLVRAMKSFSYKDSDNRAYADLNEAIRTTLTVARNEVKYVADVILDLGELPEVNCHVGDLNQVFLNLLVNAADAMQDRDGRGEIRISTRTEGPLVMISFADNGPGIPEHLRHAVFEPFFTTKEVGKGTGQGLALARAVVLDKHGGTIELQSEVGRGTEFILRLPAMGKRIGPA